MEVNLDQAYAVTSAENDDDGPDDDGPDDDADDVDDDDGPNDPDDDPGEPRPDEPRAAQRLPGTLAAYQVSLCRELKAARVVLC